MHRLASLVFALLVIWSLIDAVATLLDVRIDAGSRAVPPAVQHRAQRYGRSRGAARRRPVLFVLGLWATCPAAPSSSWRCGCAVFSSDGSDRCSSPAPLWGTAGTSYLSSSGRHIEAALDVDHLRGARSTQLRMDE
jgi:hypothetical protein